MTGLQTNLIRFFAMYAPDTARTRAIHAVYDSQAARDYLLRHMTEREMPVPHRRAYARQFIANLQAMSTDV